ncbi:hypothetical protein niasHT_002966 [Heterodera trifolii]|uniref:Integrase catalytic domain-containing protein n=1 Tax=Heterodera trifolii TaxID=157864 RepID=A0ABD2LP28_9BILA
MNRNNEPLDNGSASGNEIQGDLPSERQDGERANAAQQTKTKKVVDAQGLGTSQTGVTPAASKNLRSGTIAVRSAWDQTERGADTLSARIAERGRKEEVLRGEKRGERKERGVERVEKRRERESEFEIEYVNTTEFGQADALSRLIAKSTSPEEDRDIASMECEKEAENFFINALETVSLSSKEIISAGNEDETIKKVKEFVKDGWPNDKAIASETEEIKLFFRRKDDLSITKECVMPPRNKADEATGTEPRVMATDSHGLCRTILRPETIVSDNGTQFSSKEFADFTQTNGIIHCFSAPYNPMSNGQAERFVDSFKRTFRKLKGEGALSAEIIETFLTAYRTTPNDTLQECKSPAEAFLGRKVRTTLDLLRPPQFQPMERDELMERRLNKRFGAKPREFGPGDKIFARHRISQNWRPGNVVKKTGQVRAEPEDEQPQDGAVQNEADQDEFGRADEEKNDGRIEQEEPPNEEMPITPRVYPRRNRRPPDRYSPH